METLLLQTKDKKESRLIMELLNKMQVNVKKLSKDEQEDFVFGTLIKEATKEEAKPSSIEKIISKWK
jgi:transcriptional/translational regulatory protein YebC/TACO1